MQLAETRGTLAHPGPTMVSLRWVRWGTCYLSLFLSTIMYAQRVAQMMTPFWCPTTLPCCPASDQPQICLGCCTVLQLCQPQSLNTVCASFGDGAFQCSDPSTQTRAKNGKEMPSGHLSPRAHNQKHSPLTNPSLLMNSLASCI